METPTELKQRLFKEAQAMVFYIAARGIDKEMPNASLMTSLDLPADQRETVSLSEVLALHQGLARAVAPAFPETIEKLHEHREQGAWWRRLAPLNSILGLIVSTIALIVLFGWGLSQTSHVDLQESYFQALNEVYATGGTAATGASLAADASSNVRRAAEVNSMKLPYFQPVIEYLQGKCRLSIEELASADQRVNQTDPKLEFDDAIRNHEEHCQTLRRPILLRMFLFFGALGMLGAAYSSIYDSFSYIREGRYDLRLASTYYVRILLGGFSGVLLAEPLSDFLEQGVLSSALLAFVGGFSAQLVYDLLTKIVDSVANMFRADRRKEVQGILAQAELNARSIISEDDATKRHGLATVLSEAQQEPDAEKRAKKMQDAILAMLSGNATGDHVPNATANTTHVLGALRDVTWLVELSQHVAPVLPDASPDAAGAATKALSAARLAIKNAQTEQTPEILTKADAALSAARDADLITTNVQNGISSLQKVLQGDALTGVTKGALVAASLLDANQIMRWHYVAYGAAEATGSLLDGVAVAEIRAGLSTPSGQEIPATSLLEQLRAGGADGVFDAEGNSFPDRGAFDSALSGWMDTTVREVLTNDIRDLIIPEIDVPLSAGAFVEALARIAPDESARGGLQLLELVGSGVSETSAQSDFRTHLLTLATSKLNTEAIS
ncbi:MAG: hypothetical protein R8G34_07950 [Paracoccaceae bacterium]|nr:hypothetical protein [Paracoccaceae bacterium]